MNTTKLDDNKLALYPQCDLDRLAIVQLVSLLGDAATVELGGRRLTMQLTDMTAVDSSSPAPQRRNHFGEHHRGGNAC